MTVIAPSHAAALQMRRRLVEVTPFAAVRFEPLPRVAELLGAGALAASGRNPLARPIGDYVAAQVAHEATGALQALSDLPGFATALRQMFRRLRRGGIRHPSDVQPAPAHAHLREVVRLYGRFRDATAAFYDEEDLLDAAALSVQADTAGALADLGRIVFVPPAAQTGAGQALVEALEAAATGSTLIEGAPELASSFVLAPDPVTEAREVVRETIGAMEAGVPFHEIAVFYGADPAYRKLLTEAFEAAGVPAASLPGTPLIETPAGRAVLALCELPARDYSRSAVIDALALAPLRRTIPGADDERVHARVTAWDRLSRAAGITRGAARWERGLDAMEREHRAQLERPAEDVNDARRRMLEIELEQLPDLRSSIAALIQRLSSLEAPQPASEFVAELKSVVADYIDRNAPGLDRVNDEIDQLGTVASVGGSFTIEQFAGALGANLRTAHTREQKLGDGILLAEHRIAAGLRFRRVILCGAREGAFPAGPGEDAIVPDTAWRDLRTRFPFIEDAALRSERAKAAARRAIASASGGTLTWCAPLYEPNGAREFYPSTLMVEAAGGHDDQIRTATALRRRGAAEWLRRGASPLSLRLRGVPLDASELHIREAVDVRQRRNALPAGHRRETPLAMLRARRRSAFSEWDGNVGAADGTPWLAECSTASPTALEAYGTCGFRYFCSNVLRLRATKEPEEREMMESHVRGTLVHDVLERFFRETQTRGRPREGERWTEADRARLLDMLEEELTSARDKGALGLEIFTGHERSTLRADLSEFLEQDNVYRQRTGAIPAQFEQRIPETAVAGLLMRGVVDRIDRSQDGRRAWVMDYKTGSSYSFKDLDKDPLASGTKLQLPTYLFAVPDAEKASAFYWFISQRGGFEMKAYEPLPELSKRFENTVGAIARGIREGVFPAVPGEFQEHRNRFENCTYCDFDRICARRREEAFADKQGDPDMLGWLSVASAAEGT